MSRVTVTGLRRSCAAALALGLAVCGAGCYSTRTPLADNAKTVAVPLFQNRTYATDYARQWENEVTEAVRQAFLENGRLALANRDGADLILEGQVIKADRVVLRQDRYGEAAETQLVISTKVSLYHAKTTKYLFKDRVITNTTDRHNSGVYNLRRGEGEEMAKRKALEDLGRNIARQALDYW